MIITADASSSGQCTGDAAVIIDMARALATAVGDPEPGLTVEDLVRDGCCTQALLYVAPSP
jgi:hypothetical protein